MPLSRINSAAIANNAVVAADIADGTITAAKIVSIANTQITGNIISSQITSVGGSQITANTIANSAFQTGAVENYMNAAGLGFGMRNRIINGAMTIDQRNAGASVTPANGAYTLDRWAAFTNGAGVYTVQQSSTAPAGFTNSLRCTVTTVDSSVTGTDYYMLQHKVEGFNSADFAWGSASATSVTLSFWVRSSITGTYSVKLGNSASDRYYVATYTINSADTWEQKTITLTGDTSGTWVTNNGTGIEIRFAMAIGSSFTTSTLNAWTAGSSFGATTASNNWIGTNGATFYITGVQLEKGSTATSFDYRPYGTELALCQRYFYTLGGETAYQNINTVIWYGASECVGQFSYPVTMRAIPTVSKSGNWTTLGSGTGGPNLSGDQVTTKNMQLGAYGGSGGTAGYGATLRASNDTSLRVTFSAEL